MKDLFADLFATINMGIMLSLVIALVVFIVKAIISSVDDKDAKDTKDDKDGKAEFFADHPSIEKRLEPFEHATVNFVDKFDEDFYLNKFYSNSNHYSKGYWLGKFRDACQSAALFRNKYYDIVKIRGLGQEKLSYVYKLEDEFVEVYRKIAAMMNLDDVKPGRMNSLIMELEGTSGQMEDLLGSLVEEVPCVNSEENQSTVESKPYAALVKIMKEHESNEDVATLGDEILKLYVEWNQVIKTGLMDEFFETRKMLDDLTERLSDLANGQCSKEIITKQYEKAKKNISLLQEIAEIRMKNDAETVEDELNLDSWSTVLESILKQEQLKI